MPENKPEIITQEPSNQENEETEQEEKEEPNFHYEHLVDDAILGVMDEEVTESS